MIAGLAIATGGGLGVYSISKRVSARLRESNSRAESQFFIVVGPDAATLKPDYTIFGAVTQGIEVAQAFQRFRPTGDGQPTVPLYMFKVDITESG